MSREKKEVFEKIKKGFLEDTIAGAKLKKDLPLLATNLNNPKHLQFLFDEYKKEGLVPKKYKTAEELKNYLQRRINATYDGIIKSDPTIKGDKGFKKAFFNKRRQEILSEMVQKEAISKLTKAQKANPEIMEQISKMKWKGLPIKINSKGDLSFNRRYFQDKVSKRVIDYANNIEPGLGDKWAKEMRASWNAIGERNRAIKASSGLSFDIGHFIPSQLDGPNVGLNAAPELSTLNRSKGSTPFTSNKNISRQIGVPESWMQSFTDWHLSQQGMDPNLLPKGYGLKGSQVVDAASGVSDPNAEIAKNLRKFELDQQVIPEGKLQSDFEIVNNKVVKAGKNIANGSNGSNGVKNGYKNGKQQILKVLKNVNRTSNLIPTPVRRTVFTAAALAPGVLGTAASAADVVERGKKYEESKNWLDGIQLGLANASLFTGWTGVGEMIATPADLMNLGLDAARFGTRETDTSMRKRFRHGSR
jgi:hypothetical protein